MKLFAILGDSPRFRVICKYHESVVGVCFSALLQFGWNKYIYESLVFEIHSYDEENNVCQAARKLASAGVDDILAKYPLEQSA